MEAHGMTWKKQMRPGTTNSMRLVQIVNHVVPGLNFQADGHGMTHNEHQHSVCFRVVPWL